MSLPTVAKLDRFSFTGEHHQVLTRVPLAVSRSHQVELVLQYGNSEGFDAVRVSVNDDPSGVSVHLLSIHSLPVDGQIRFAAISYDKKPIGPEPSYASFQEAVAHAHVFALSFIEIAKAQRAGSFQKAKDPTLPEQPSRHTPPEALIFQEFGSAIGVWANRPGFARSLDSPSGLLVMGLGYLDRGRPIVLGSVVVTDNGDGTYGCSVRGFEGAKLPGPQFYDDIGEALAAARPYFEFMAKKTVTFLNRPWWKRVFT